MAAPDADGKLARSPSGPSVPMRLATVDAPDPFHVEPGAILLSRRFCVIGPQRHRAGGWQVTATDLKRRFGVLPHYRLELVFMMVSEAERDRMFAAIDAMAEAVPRVYAVLATDDGVVLVTHPFEPLPTELTVDQHRQAAHDLARLLARLHEAGWSRIRWNDEAWRIDDAGRVQFADWSWLRDVERAKHPAAQRDDVTALQRLFQGPLWPTGARREVSSAAELLAGLGPAEAEAGPTFVLGRDLPFVGRSEALAVIEQAVDHAREDGPTLLTIAGPSGVGKTDLLTHAATRLDAEAVVVRCTKPHLGGLLVALADAFETLDSVRRREIRDRICLEVGDGSQELSIFDRRFEAWFGGPPPRQRVVREYPRRLTRLVALLAAVGSAKHPLVLLIDRFDEVSGAIRNLCDRLLGDGEAHATAIVRAMTSTTGEAVTLTPLAVSEVEEWLRGTLPGSVHDASAMAQWLYEEVGSWPGDLVAGLQRAISAGAIAERSGWRLVRTPELRPPALDELGDDARWLALLLAVEGGRGGIRSLQRLARWPIDRLREGLTELRRTGFVRAEGNALVWIMPRHRQEVVAKASAEQCRHAHRAMARYLSRKVDVSTSALVSHEDRGQVDGIDAALALRHLRAAEEQMRHLNFERAQWHYERAAARDLEPSVQRRAQRGRADALLLTGCVDKAIVAYRGALTHAGGPEDVLAIADRATHALAVRNPQATMELVNEALGRIGRPVPGGWLSMGWEALRTWLGVGPSLGPAALRSLGVLHRTVVEHLPLIEAHRLPILWFRGLVVAGQTQDEAALRRSRIQFARGPVRTFAPRWAQQILTRALEGAQRDDDAVGEGLAWFGRAELWWPTGRAADARHALERAIERFRVGGEPALQARAEAALLVHQLFCASLDHVEVRLESLRRVARKQHQQDFGPLIDAIQRWIRVRGDRSPGTPVEPTGDPPMTVMGVWADAIAALAWVEADEVVVAQRYAERAWEARQRFAVRPPALDLALVAVAWVAVRRGRPFIQPAERWLTALRHQARENPTLEPFGWLVEAHLAIAEDASARAQHALDRVLQTAAVQRQRWVALDGHALLARFWATGAPHQAERQRELTEQLRAELVGFTPPPPAGPLPLPEPLSEEAVRLDHLVHDMLETLRPHLDGRDVETALLAGQRTTVPREALELLFVSMMLLVHEVVEGPKLSISLEPRPDDVVAIKIVAGPPSEEPNALAIAECDNVANQIGARLTIETSPRALLIEAAVPADRVVVLHRGLVAICVDDLRVERMLVEQLRHLGWDAMIPHPDDSLDVEVVGGFVTPGHRLNLPPDAWTIWVVPRSEGWQHRSELPLPFVLDELRTLLDPLPSRTSVQVDE